MAQTVSLPDDLAAALTAEAARAGVSLADYAIGLLATARPPAAVRTGADLVAYWQAERLLGDGPGQPDSPELARQLREQAQRRTG